ncbi:dTDP-4-amino-4,6-dideoxygalactose transaminase [Poritiphilus flavus]|uniref:dTDP-4-amino-4,6-dideoxygalactose transaminase n=1 Tax=Poritiphilus flavus TaxID=2697053 RepID=A0A6L9EDZ1_9FLAO|nr:dTDP-4-amino-4,6-dideoxygalactose transaminase [Poritiphilus flavus]NAS12861.1 dTDP-4-amino-4,6-dideoxygalactose transaminase [Poritiphilus flavus]
MDPLQFNIPFNKPHLTGKELVYIRDAVESGQLSGNGKYTKMCQRFFEEEFGFLKCLLTSSCTDALEMAAILLNIKEGDEIIVPAYTFVSTANAFVLRGAKIVFADCRKDNPNMDEDLLEDLITPRTKAIVPVHYSGVACNMERIMELAEDHGIYVIEDAAQAVNSYFTDTKGNKHALGSIGHMATFSFHETKNIISGEGGMLVINDPELVPRAEIIWEKGTNRSAFFRNEVKKYEWVDIGSSFLPSEVTAAFLYAQLESMDKIHQKRRKIWDTYFERLSEWAKEQQIQLPSIPAYATNNAHLFYLVARDLEQRDLIIDHLKKQGILAIFHYLSLHRSPFYAAKHGTRELPESDRLSNSLLRLPLFYGLSEEELDHIIENLKSVPFNE